ncbi:unnamed protein product [Closterium sp. NIES-53]
MTLRPSTAPQRVPLPSPPASSLPAGPDPASDSLRAASPAVTRFLATVVTNPLFESTAASALVTELVDFVAACRLDYAFSLVTESVSAPVYPPSVAGECALGTDVLEDRQEEFECFAASVPHLVSMLIAPEGDPDAPDIPTPRSYAEAKEGPYSSKWQAAMDAEMASTGTYIDEVPLPGANIVSGMWIFRVKWPPGSPPVFKARYVARGFCQRQGVDFFQTFSPTPKMTTLRVLLHVAAQRDYELHSLDFSTAFLQGSLHEEIWLRRPLRFTGSFPAGTQWSLRRPVYGLRQAPREWHDTLKTTLSSLGFAPSTADPSLFLRTDTTLPPFYVLVYVDDLVFSTGACRLIFLMTCTRPDLAYPLSLLARYVAPSRHQKDGYELSSVVMVTPPGSSCEAEIYTGAMAAQELRWLTYLLTDLGEVPRSPPVLYQRGELRLAYVASQANTADVFTKALQPCDHQPCFAFLTGLVTLCSPPLCLWGVSGPPRVPEADEDETPSDVKEGAPEDEHQPPPGTPAADTSEHPESQPEGSQASPPTTISRHSDATPLNPLALKLLRFVQRVNGGMGMAEVDITGLLQLVVEPGLAPLVTSELRNCKDLERFEMERLARLNRGWSVVAFEIDGHPPQRLRFQNLAQEHFGWTQVVGGTILYLDVTHMSNNGRKKAWLLMMTLANISQAKRWGKAGHTLLALLPIPPSAMSAVEKVMLFQRCVTIVLQPLLDGMERSVSSVASCYVVTQSHA